MSHDYKARIAEVDEYAMKLRELIPGAMAAFVALSRAAQADGALDHKAKELIAIAVAVAMRCDACIAYHTRAAQRAGVARQEVAEAIAVAIQLGGGPSVNYAADALRAFDQFSAEPGRA